MSLSSEIIDSTPILNPLGCIARDCWLEIPAQFSHILLDEYVIMPDQVHGILILTQPDVGATHASPLHEISGRPRGPQRHLLGAIIGSYKAAVSHRAHQISAYHNLIIWQRNCYERIIRDETELNAARKYILENPLGWHLDQETLAI